MLLTEKELEGLSFKNSSGRSLKELPITKVNITNLISDIESYTNAMKENCKFKEIANKRIKSEDSVVRKILKNIETPGYRASQCFNDILGIRFNLEEYPETFPNYLRFVDLRLGKKVDDGYRAIHLYYTKDNFHYPIEIQIWAGEDIDFNTWSHTDVYKYTDPSIGKGLRDLYDIGLIDDKEKFSYYRNKLEADLNVGRGIERNDGRRSNDEDKGKKGSGILKF